MARPVRPMERRVRGIVTEARRRWVHRGERVELPPRPAPPGTPVRLLVGPANFAGQGWAWARAAERLPGVGAEAFAVVTDRIDFRSDYAVPRATFTSPRWQRDQRRHVTRTFTHVLIEAARPVLGARGPYGDRCTGDIPILREAGLAVAVVAHGSDVRLPSEHADRYRWSPFGNLPEQQRLTLERGAVANRALMAAHDGPVYVSTPDLLDDVPSAEWLPVVVDPNHWKSDAPVLRRARPVVVHAPSSSPMKGSDLVDPILDGLAADGLIEYRRVEGVEPAAMPAIYGDADIVLDQFRLGSYGAAACEAMAAGRVVVGHVAPAVRARVRSTTGADLPIVEAPPDNVGQVVRDLVADRDAARSRAAAGPVFVERVHDGRRSAEIMGSFLRPA